MKPRQLPIVKKRLLEVIQLQIQQLNLKEKDAKLQQTKINYIHYIKPITTILNTIVELLQRKNESGILLGAPNELDQFTELSKILYQLQTEIHSTLDKISADAQKLKNSAFYSVSKFYYNETNFTNFKGIIEKYLNTMITTITNAWANYIYVALKYDAQIHSMVNILKHAANWPKEQLAALEEQGKVTQTILGFCSSMQHTYQNIAKAQIDSYKNAIKESTQNNAYQSAELDLPILNQFLGNLNNQFNDCIGKIFPLRYETIREPIVTYKTGKLDDNGNEEEQTTYSTKIIEKESIPADDIILIKQLENECTKLTTTIEYIQKRISHSTQLYDEVQTNIKEFAINIKKWQTACSNNGFINFANKLKTDDSYVITSDNYRMLARETANCFYLCRDPKKYNPTDPAAITGLLKNAKVDIFFNLMLVAKDHSVYDHFYEQFDTLANQSDMPDVLLNHCLDCISAIHWSNKINTLENTVAISRGVLASLDWAFKFPNITEQVKNRVIGLLFIGLNTTSLANDLIADVYAFCKNVFTNDDLTAIDSRLTAWFKQLQNKQNNEVTPATIKELKKTLGIASSILDVPSIFAANKVPQENITVTNTIASKIKLSAT